MKQKASSDNWARELARGAVSIKQLRSLDLVSEETLFKAAQIENEFATRVPASQIEAIKGQEESIRRQFVPSSEELRIQQQERDDPIGDQAHSPCEGLVHRYRDRVLLMPTHLCASYCRYCFRRYKVSHGGGLSPSALKEALSYIRKRTEVREVILTGGDPLTLTDRKLAQIFSELSEASHLRTLRIHTRIPTVLPSRVSEELLEILRTSRLIPWVVSHINTHHELNTRAKEALTKLRKAGIPLLSQSVLLRGVNDSTEALKTLFLALAELGVKPYYLHQLDLAKGTHHFRVDLSRARSMMAELQGHLPGYCIPKLMVDLPGGLGKVPAEKEWAQQTKKDHWKFQSPIKKDCVQTVHYPPSN